MNRRYDVMYRRRLDSPVWHWCRTCPEWPSISQSIERRTTPREADLCADCRREEALGECMYNPA